MKKQKNYCKGASPALGDARQIWFTRDGNLFQLILYSDNIEWLDVRGRVNCLTTEHLVGTSGTDGALQGF